MVEVDGAEAAAGIDIDPSCNRNREYCISSMSVSKCKGSYDGFVSHDCLNFASLVIQSCSGGQDNGSGTNSQNMQAEDMCLCSMLNQALLIPLAFSLGHAVTSFRTTQDISRSQTERMVYRRMGDERSIVLLLISFAHWLLHFDPLCSASRPIETPYSIIMSTYTSLFFRSMIRASSGDGKRKQRLQASSTRTWEECYHQICLRICH
jgi:hypothetical protein